jgi:prepilin signal peptidase PulO-like enzyme (type II secretory pathway)
MNTLLNILAAAAAAFLGVLAGFGVIYVFNKMPAKWLCDYNETPDERHIPPRIGKYPWGLVFSAILATASFKVGYMISWQYAIAVLPALWSLLIISISDKKYRIIPDQFIIVLAVTGIGFVTLGMKLLPSYLLGGTDIFIFSEKFSFMSPVIGLLIGGGSFFLVGTIGKFVMKKDIMGFGDVKLIGTCGLISGAYGILMIMILTALTSAVFFSVQLARKKLKAQDTAALGPFIALSTGLFLIFPKEIAHLADLLLRM